MLAMLLFTGLGLSAALGTGSIVVTWLQYGSAWDQVAIEMRQDRNVHTSRRKRLPSGISGAIAAVRRPEIRICTPEFKVELAVSRSSREQRAAA